MRFRGEGKEPGRGLSRGGSFCPGELELVPNFLEPCWADACGQSFLQLLQSRLLPGAIPINASWESAAPWKLFFYGAGPEKLARNKEREAPSFAFYRGPSSATRYPLCPPPHFALGHTPKARCRLKATAESLLQTCFEETSSSVCRGIRFQFSPRADLAPAGFRSTGRGWGLRGTADRERLLRPRTLIVQPPSEARPAAF